MAKKDKKEKGELTQAEIEAEIGRVGDLFKLIPEDLRADAAVHFAIEVAISGSYNHLEALGILEEAKLNFREISLKVMAEEDEEANGNE